MKIPDENGCGLDDTRLSVENIHEDHVIVEPNSKLQAETEAAIFVKENNEINVYCHQDNGEEEKTVDMFYMDRGQEERVFNLLEQRRGHRSNVCPRFWKCSECVKE